MIQFTGSTAVGRRVAELAGKTLKKVSLELGGNNALIVLEDANVEAAVNNAAWGAWLHQGQICMASSRVFVHNSVREEFTRQLAEKASHLPAGDPATVSTCRSGPDYQRAPTAPLPFHHGGFGEGGSSRRSRRQLSPVVPRGHCAVRRQTRHARLR